MVPNGASAVLTIVFGIAIPFAMAAHTLLSWIGYKRDRQRIERAKEGTPNLVSGRIALFGRATPLDDDTSSPVWFEVTQEATESTYKSKSGTRVTTTTWTETSRKSSARPFGLLLPSGELVEVRADANTTLTDTLNSASFPHPRRRVCRAELRFEEEALVQGELCVDNASLGTGPFRGSEKTTMYVKAPWRSTLQVSSASTIQALTGYIKIYRALFWTTVVLTLVAHLFAFDAYWFRHSLKEAGVFAIVLTPFVYGIMAYALRRVKPWYALDRIVHSGTGNVTTDSARNAGLERP